MRKISSKIRFKISAQVSNYKARGLGNHAKIARFLAQLNLFSSWNTDSSLSKNTLFVNMSNALQTSFEGFHQMLANIARKSNARKLESKIGSVNGEGVSNLLRIYFGSFNLQ